MGGTQNFVHKLLDITMYIIKLRRSGHSTKYSSDWSVKTCKLWSRTLRLCRASESRDKIAGVTSH